MAKKGGALAKWMAQHGESAEPHADEATKRVKHRKGPNHFDMEEGHQEMAPPTHHDAYPDEDDDGIC